MRSHNHGATVAFNDHARSATQPAAALRGSRPALRVQGSSLDKEEEEEKKICCIICNESHNTKREN